MNSEEHYFYRVGLNEEEEFVEDAVYLHLLREEGRRRADRERRWHRLKPWIGAGIAGLILGGCFWAIMAILR